MMTNLPKIEKNISPPGRSIYGLGRFEVGDSAFYGEEYESSRIRTAACMFGRKHPSIKFSTHKCTENGVDGIRVWRIA